MSKRWPLHPLPYPDESLLSWITRAASFYDMNVWDLLECEFGINLEIHDLYTIDLNPPISLLNKLSERTGIELNTICALTAQVYVPLLVDTLEETEVNLFNEYTNQFNIFPSKRKNITNLDNSWIPWFDIERFSTLHGCRTCLNEDHEPHLRLYWRFPWMMSCPIHKLLLEQVSFHVLGEQKIYFYFSENNNPTATASQAVDFLYVMDTITLQAVTKGVVELSSGKLHGGMWLRILRTLIEELNSLVKTIGNKTRNLMAPFWQELGLFVREGFGRYTFFEQCDCNKQLRLMLVAALVFKAIFSKEIKFSNTVVNLLTPLPIYDNDLCSVYQEPIIKTSLLGQQEQELSISSPFEKFSKYMDELIVLMRSDPEAVKTLRNFIKSFDSNNTRLASVDECLKNLGIKVDTV